MFDPQYSMVPTLHQIAAPCVRVTSSGIPCADAAPNLLNDDVAPVPYRKCVRRNVRTTRPVSGRPTTAQIYASLIFMAADIALVEENACSSFTAIV